MAMWDRQQGESAQAYEAARAYFGLGADRSLNAVAQKLNKSFTLMGRWSRTWNWIGRASAYDQHLAALEQQKREQAVAVEAEKWATRRAEQRENDWALSIGLANAAAQILQALDPKQARASDAARLAEASNKLARLAAEMATDQPHVVLDPIDWSRVPREVTVAFAEGRIGLDDVLRHTNRNRTA